VNASHIDIVNTRWVRYALPEGQPPAGGWPVYLVFSPWDVPPVMQEFGNHGNQNMTCGQPSKYKPDPKCMAYLHDHCSWDYANCTKCAEHLKKTDPQFGENNCNKSSYQIHLFCHSRGVSFGSEINAFHDPRTVSSACFSQNGTYKKGGNCSFESVNGFMWWQRINQHLLANGVAVVQVQ
jgi:hypothetical protein